MDIEVLYAPIGVATFDLEWAQKEFDSSIKMLKGICQNVTVPEEMLLSIDKLNEFLKNKSPDLVIVQSTTFANGAYITEILRKFDVPILLWALREPVIDGGRLRLNSLTGAFSAGNVLHSFGRQFEYIFGLPEEENVIKKITSTIKAVKVKKELSQLNILQIGHTPQGFGFGKALDVEINKTFGANLISIEARELIDKAKAINDNEIEEYLSDAKSKIKSLDKIPLPNVVAFAKLYKAYHEYIKSNNIGAISSRCWPDFFTDYGTPVCAVLAMMNDLGIPSACEADTYGALSMYIGQQLTNKATFFGDPVSLDEGENTITFWHCGTASTTLARQDTGALAGVHCNRKIGPTLEFGCKAEPKVTIFRVGKDGDGSFRFFISSGEALDKPQQFYGTSIVVKTNNNASEIVTGAIKNGWEPHFAVAMGDIADELEILGNILGIKTSKF